MSSTRVVVITGCDSGLGWAMAARAAREGMTTVAGMLGGADSQPAKALRDLSAHPYPLDVTSQESVNEFRQYVDGLIKENPNYSLYAVVNNAGVMTIGDYEWQPQDLVENTVKVNLLGAMRVISAFLPELRKVALGNTLRPRIINVTSHCGIHPLPGFAAYGASKAGLQALTRALRFEHRAHGLDVLAFVPGGFVGSSNILSKQVIQGEKMLENLNEEQRTFYGKRITSLINYLRPLAGGSEYDALRDDHIIGTFVQALTAARPKEMYKVEPTRYKFYYSLMALPLPEVLRHWLIKKFLSFPEQQ